MPTINDLISLLGGAGKTINDKLAKICLGLKNIWWAPKDAFTETVNAAQNAYTRSGERQVVVLDRAASIPATFTVPKGVVLQAPGYTDYHHFQCWRDGARQETFVLPYPAAIVYRIDDPAQSGGGITNWWTSTQSELTDPMFNNATTTPLDYARRRGIIISFGQVAGKIGQSGTYTYFNRAQLQRIVHYGNEICSHSVTHGAVSTESEMRYETEHSKELIEEALADNSNRPSWSISGQCASSIINFPVADRCSSFIIPGAWSNSQAQILTSGTPRSQTADYVMRMSYDTVQRHSQTPPSHHGKTVNKYYCDWDYPLNPASLWNESVRRVLSRAKCYPFIVTIAHHGPTVNEGTTSAPTTTQWKTLIDHIYDNYVRPGFATTIPMNASGRVILTPSPYGPLQPDMWRGGIPHGLLDIDSTFVSNGDAVWESGVVRTVTGDGRLDLVENSSFSPSNNLHPYPQGYVAKFYWGASPSSGNAVLKFVTRVTPASRYQLRFDFVAPSSGNGQNFYVTLQQWQELSGDSWSRVAEEWLLPTATNSWQTMVLNIYVYPQTTRLDINFSLNYSNRIADKGFAISNVQLYRVG